jgi:hypothetical protein
MAITNVLTGELIDACAYGLSGYCEIGQHERCAHRPGGAHEHGHESPAAMLCRRGRGFYQASTPRDRDHLAQKPLEVMRGLVRVAPPGGLVLDPFTGSGTTGVAALVEGRRFLGIEVNPHWAAHAGERLARLPLAATAGDQPALLADLDELDDLGDVPAGAR